MDQKKRNKALTLSSSSTTITAKGEVKGKEKAGDKKTGIESLKNPPIDMSKILPVGSEDDKGNRIWWKHDSLCMCTVDDGVWFQRVYRRSPSPERKSSPLPLR